MGAKLVIAPEAERDLDEAYASYEKQRVGLGEDFLLSVDAFLCFVASRMSVESSTTTIVERSYGVFRMLSFTSMLTKS